MNDLARLTLSIAATQIGVREHGNNRGPEVDQYWRDCGWLPGGINLPPPNTAKAWCAVFVSAMVTRACQKLGLAVPFHRSPGCYTLEEQFPGPAKSQTPVAGSIFILKGHKHTGLVDQVMGDGTMLATIEGNTNASGSPNGDGVYRHPRHASEIMVYLDLSALPMVSGVA